MTDTPNTHTSGDIRENLTDSFFTEKKTEQKKHILMLFLHTKKTRLSKKTKMTKLLTLLKFSPF